MMLLFIYGQRQKNPVDMLRLDLEKKSEAVDCQLSEKKRIKNTQEVKKNAF